MARSIYRKDYDTFLKQASLYLPMANKALGASLYLDAVRGDTVAEAMLFDLLADEGINLVDTRARLEYGKRSYSTWSKIRCRQFAYYCKKYGFPVK